MSFLSRRKGRLLITIGAKAAARIADVCGTMVWPGITASRPIPIRCKALYKAVSRESADKTRFMLISSW